MRCVSVAGLGAGWGRGLFGAQGLPAIRGDDRRSLMRQRFAPEPWPHRPALPVLALPLREPSPPPPPAGPPPPPADHDEELVEIPRRVIVMAQRLQRMLSCSEESRPESPRVGEVFEG